jgi:hypothetical protein
MDLADPAVRGRWRRASARRLRKASRRLHKHPGNPALKAPAEPWAAAEEVPEVWAGLVAADPAADPEAWVAAEADPAADSAAWTPKR